VQSLFTHLFQQVFFFAHLGNLKSGDRSVSGGLAAPS
jgi:hypothetical protein